jgi:hypothetical protein
VKIYFNVLNFNDLVDLQRKPGIYWDTHPSQPHPERIKPQLSFFNDDDFSLNNELLPCSSNKTADLSKTLDSTVIGSCTQPSLEGSKYKSINSMIVGNESPPTEFSNLEIPATQFSEGTDQSLGKRKN